MKTCMHIRMCCCQSCIGIFFNVRNSSEDFLLDQHSRCPGLMCVFH